MVNSPDYDGKALKSRNLFRIIIPAATAALLILVTLIIWRQAAPKEEIPFVFEHWIVINDDNSISQVSRRTEEIGGRSVATVTISGMLYGDESYHRTPDGYYGIDMPFAGVYGRPDQYTLDFLRNRMKTFSFSFQGDGNRYYMRFPTFETIEGDHWLVIFPTVAGEISSLTINIPDGLFRLGWSYKDVEFIQENIMFIQVQPVDPGDYNLKFWDIKMHD